MEPTSSEEYEKELLLDPCESEESALPVHHNSRAQASKTNSILQALHKSLLRLRNLNIPQTRASRLCAICGTGRQGKKAVVKKVHDTAWLDGLRGVDALLVFFVHYHLWGHDAGVIEALRAPGGYGGEHVFATSPIVRLFFSGPHFDVHTFFIISGYVLTHKPLKLIHAEQYDSAAVAIQSGLGRRWIRLFLPTMTTTFLWMTSWHIFGIRSPYDAGADGYLNEIVRWWHCVVGENAIYNMHTWTIPVEFRGSILVWVIVLATARFTTIARLGVQVLVWIWFVQQCSHYAPFVAGIIFCDVSLLLQQERHATKIMRWAFSWPGWLCIFVMGLLFASFGASGAVRDRVSIDKVKTDPLYFLRFLNLPGFSDDFHYWFTTIGTLMVVVSIPKIPWLKSALESCAVQFLGRISFMFYLIHGPLLWSIGVRLYSAAGVERHHIYTWWWRWFPLSNSGPLGLEPRFWVPILFMLPLTQCLALLLTRYLDTPCVKLGHWLVGKCTRSELSS